MMDNQSSEDIVSHLYVTEAYYFNPKQVKRTQLVRLVSMIQDNRRKLGFGSGASKPGGPIRDKEERRRNFFERKRWLNYPDHST